MPEDMNVPVASDSPGPAPDLAPALQTGVPAARTEQIAGPPPAETRAAPSVPAAPAGKGDPVSTLLDQLKNLPVSQVDALLHAIEQETGNAAQGPPDEDDEFEPDEYQVDDSSVSRQGPIRYAEVEPGMQKAISMVHNHMMEQAVSAAIDSDENLSYNMKALSPKAREAVVAFVKDGMEKLIDEQGDRFDYNWARVAQQAFARAKPRIEPLMERPTPKAGMGPGQGADHYMSRPLQEPKRVPAYADAEDHATYLQQKLAYNYAQAEREMQVPGM